MTATIIPFPAHGSRRQPHTHSSGFDSPCEQDANDWVRQAGGVLDRVEAMLDADQVSEVTTLCEQAVRCLLDAAPEIDDGDAVSALVDRLRHLHLRACMRGAPEPLRLATFVHRMAWAAVVSVLRDVVDPYVPLLGDAGRSHLRRMLREDERRVGPTSGAVRSVVDARLRAMQASLARGDHPSAV